MKTLYARPLLAAILAVTLVGGPISPAFGQDAPQNPQQRKPSRDGHCAGFAWLCEIQLHRAPRPFPTCLLLIARSRLLRLCSPIRRASTSSSMTESWS